MNVEKLQFFQRHRPGSQPVAVLDEREFERIRMVLGLVCRQGERSFNIFTDDVSVKGIRFLSQQPVSEGEPLLLFLPLPDRLPVMCTAIWVRQDGPMHWVGGVLFDNLADDDRRRWANFISKNQQVPTQQR